jgi:hypothetical protein
VTLPGGRPVPVQPDGQLAPSDVVDVEHVAHLVRAARIMWEARLIDGRVRSLGQVLNGD